MYKLAGNTSAIITGESSLAAWPFIQCMEFNEGASSAASSCYASTMATSGVPYSTITACAANEASDVQKAGKEATPTHDYVPWVLVDGKLLSNTNLLLPTICKAYTGPAPASCSRNLNEAPSVCFNK
jgi:hypothetical protein